MEAKFTPGPWCLFPMETGWYVNQQGGPGYVGTMHKHSHRAEECEANARLISAAPDLLEACATFEEWLRREGAGFPDVARRDTPEGEAAWREWYDGNLALCSRAQDLSRAALSKALGLEGEQQ